MMILDNDEYGISRMQVKLMDLLKYFISLCEDNNLRYWLVGGTCLGALRHNGFIPWDDDLDICMPRADYEKLWQLYRNGCQNTKYKIGRTSEEKNYHHRVMQLIDLDTTFINQRCSNEDIEHGVYIDIIPIDAQAPGKISRLVQKINAVIFSVYNIQSKAEYNGGILTKPMNMVTSVMLWLIRDKHKRYQIWRKAEARMIKYPIVPGCNIVVLTSAFKELFQAYPYDWWFGNRLHKFEDIDASIPNNAEGYCTTMYGNYMLLPPKEKRHARHNTVLIDLDHPYTVYKGKYYCTGSLSEE